MKEAEANSSRFVVIDREGFLHQDGIRIADLELGENLLAELHYNSGRALATIFDRQEILVESFDDPLLVQRVELVDSAQLPTQIRFHCHYDYEWIGLAQDLLVDEWDRFHGRLENGVGYVLSAKAQAMLFDLASEFTDTSMTFGADVIELGAWLPDAEKVETPQFWSGIYKEAAAESKAAPWDLGEPVRALTALIAKMKLTKSRIAVLGAGGGHDAAYWAELGHKVTAFDISEVAIAKAKSNYPHYADRIEWIQADIFKLPKFYHKSFDVVFEHTFFCAINPSRRADAIRVYSWLLSDLGFLIGIFMIKDVSKGPPFGSTEWEVAKRLEKTFDPFYWTRFRDSQPQRMGLELAVVSRKKLNL